MRRKLVAGSLVLFALIRLATAHAQGACLVYHYSDPNTGCSAAANSAVEAVQGVIACDGPLFCGSSSVTLDSVDSDPAEAGKVFRVTNTFHANPKPGCGQDNTQSSNGSITAATGTGCPAQEFFAIFRPLPQAQNGQCTQAAGPINCLGDPINPSNGNVFDTENDVVLSSPGGLRFQRFYSSGGRGSTDLGAGWQHSYSRHLSILRDAPYIPYPPFEPHSSRYPTQAAACTSGFPQIQSNASAWAGATATWNGSSCVLQAGGQVVGTVQIQSTVQFFTPSNSIIEVQAVRDDGTTLRFSMANGVLIAQPGSSYRVQQTSTGFAFTDPDDTVEEYDSTGVLQSVTSRNGIVQTLEYDGSQRLSTVADSFGNRLTLIYDSQSRLISVNLLGGSAPASCLVYRYPSGSCNVPAPSAVAAVNGVLACLASAFCGNSYDTLVSVNSDPATPGLPFSVTLTYTASAGCGSNSTATSSGNITSGTGAQCTGSAAVQFGYDAQNRLRTAWYPDGTSRTYAYENATYPQAMTGVFDESHTRISTWTYDSKGRALTAQGAGGADAVSLAYGSSTSVTVTDALGAVRTFNFAQVGDQNLPVSISGSRCPTCSDGAATSYDPAGFPSSRTDYNGNVTCYAHDPARGLELARVEGFAPGSTCPADLLTFTPSPGTRQRKIATQWNATWREPDSIVEEGRTTAYTYDAAGNVLTETVTDTASVPNVSRVSTYTYNEFGQVLTVNGPRSDISDVTTFAYNDCASGPACGQVHTITDAQGRVTTVNNYNLYGHPLSVTDPNGITTTLTYDARQRVTSQQVGSETTSYSYFPTGLLKKITLPDSSAMNFSYDAAHRLTAITDALGNHVDFTLDALGNRTAEKIYSSTAVLRRQHTRTYNSLSRLIQDINAAGTSAVTTSFGYDAEGNQTSTAAPLSRTSASAYDELNRLSQITDPANGITQLTYDAEDRPTSVLDPRSLVTSYAYTGFGELAWQTSPDAGISSRTYDSAGNLSTFTDARGATSTFTYDALNRVTSATYAVGGIPDQSIVFTYDAGSNAIGRLTGAADADHSMGWAYDALGRVISKGQTIGGVTKSVGYGYTNGNLTSLTTPSGQAIGYGYNANGQITSVTVNGTTVLSGVTYEPFGPASGWTWGNGTITLRTHDQDGKITQIVSNGAKTYSYDDAFRISGATDSSAGASNWTYGYDAMDRITSGVNGTVTRGWTYDANGNRLSESGSAPSAYSIASDSNRITSITGALARTFGYDAAGNTVSYSTVNATYNARGRLQTLANGSITATYVYNALGELVRSSGSAGTVLYCYDEFGHLLGEYDASGNLVQETIWLGDIPVATLRPSGSGVAIYYVHTDHLNTPRQVTRPSDNVQMWTWFSDPFGTEAANENPQGAGEFKYQARFAGQVFEGPAGLHYNYFRDYDPATGRYIESDPIGLQGGISPYGYASANPLSRWDPLGLADQYDFGGGYTARVDRFNTTGGQAGFEIHVKKGDTEVGVLGPNGWINKHGHEGPPQLPKNVDNACNGIAVDEMRKAGHIPAKGRMNIKAGRWQKFLRALPWIGAASRALEPSNDRKCELTPAADGCYPTE